MLKMGMPSPEVSLSSLKIHDDPDAAPLVKNAFSEAVADFVFSTSSLIDGAPGIVAMLEAAARASRKRLVDYAKQYSEDTIPSGPGMHTFTIEIPDDKAWKLERLRNRIQRRELAIKAMQESYLITLLIQFETLVGALTRAVLTAQPEVINASGKTMTYSQLQSFASIENAREYLVGREVDELLRGSHQDYITWFEQRLGAKNKLIPLLVTWPQFVESRERRNLLIHSAGKISDQYLQECQKAGFELDQALQSGVRLEVGTAYLRTAYEALVGVGVRLSVILWLHFAPEDAGKVLAQLNDIVLEFLDENKFALGRDICQFLLKSAEKHGNDSSRKMLALNLAQAHKWLGDSVAMEDVLKKQDWSAAGLHHGLALAVLRDEWEQIEAHMRDLEKIDQMNPEFYRMWPIFSKLREEKRFQDLYLELYKEPLGDELAAMAQIAKAKQESASQQGSSSVVS